MQKPKPLKAGDHVALVSPSWGGPGKFRERYEAGKKQLCDAFGLIAVEMPHTLSDPAYLNEHPELRAQDLMEAFKNPEIKGIIATIGGEDSVRLLPYLDLDVIRSNPKIFMGYSDTTSLHFACHAAGLGSFYGPSVMSGFGENGGLHDYMKASVQRSIFETAVIGEITPAKEWTVEMLDWGNPDNQSIKRKMTPSDGWRSINGQGVAEGHLLGGCAEVLEMIKGSVIWPTPEQWKGAILFIETSEEAPSPVYFRRWIRHYGTMGILQGLNGIIVGRPGGGVENLQQYDDVILSVVRDELGLSELPILTQLDFGHTDPMFVIPYGARAEINGAKKSLRLLEPGVTS